MDIGRALSEEKDNGRLLERILRSAKELTGADGGSLYLRTDDDHLRFEIILTDSLDLYLGGTHGRPIRFPPIPLFGLDGEPNNQMVAARAATAKHTINIEDAYAATGFDFSGTRLFDARNGYRSASFLTVPMLGQSDEVIGVLQLINAIDPMTREVVAFGPRDQQLAESLASQAAIALTNKRLVDEQRYLFEAFIELMAGAIDDKSPYTGGHCRRVPELTMMLADAAAAQSDGPLRDFSMTDADRYELKIAGWLHDCGKITTPEYIVDKATKLQTIFDRIELVQTRFELAMREAEVRTLREKVKELSPDVERDLGEIESVVSTELSTLRDDYEFVSKANIGGEMMSDEHIERVHHIASREVTIADGSVALLNEDEVKNLCIRRGTLTEEEREVINHHIVATIKMLEALPYPPHLRRVPEFAGGHHERMDGRGYPRGLTREEMSVQARIMGIADIFEALTAGDRPYKKAMPLSQALRILGSMKVDNHIDPDLFDVFMKERIYLRYAELFLPSEQVDEVDLAHIPGYISDS
ncbi:MAG: HD domain-containing phosphohydrolase [Pseudomonadota bacterium]